MWSWPDIIFVGISIVTIPPYLVIIVLLIHRRKAIQLAAPFYSLIISQGFADLLYLIDYVTLIIIGNLYFTEKVKMNPVHLRFVVDLAVRILSYCLALRCLGIMFISLQRYVAVCWWSSPAFTWMNRIPTMLIIAVHWIVAALLSFPVVMVATPKLGPNREHALIFTPESYKILVGVSYVSVFPTFLICIFCYTVVLRQIFGKRYIARCNSKNAAREIQLCIQVAAFNFAFFLLFIFYLTECILILLSIKLPGIMQLMHPIMSGFLSFVIPWTLLFFNREITPAIRRRSEVNLRYRLRLVRRPWDLDMHG